MSSSIGAVKELLVKDNEYECICENGRVKISILGPKIVRVQATRRSEYRECDSFARVPYYEESQMEHAENQEGWLLRNENLSIQIDSKTCGLKLFRTRVPNQCLSEDESGRGIEWMEDGFACRKKLPKDAHIYGLGEKAYGLDKRGCRFDMWNTNAAFHSPQTDPLYQAIPFFIVFQNGAAHGVFLDNTYRTFFDFGKETDGVYSFGAPGGPLDYYFILGPTIKEVVDGYTKLTGRPHFIPLWALGHQWSRWMEYEDEEDVLSVAREFRNRRIPCDTIVLDIGYMDEFRVFTWDPEVFSSPKKFTEKLTRLGFRTMVITDPGVKLEDSFDIYREGTEKRYFLKKSDGSQYVGQVWPGDTVFPDFSKPEVREWFASKYRLLSEAGVSNSSWIDMNEPANCIFPGLEEEFTMSDVVDSEGSLWAPRLHNVYGFGMCQAAYLGLKQCFPKERPFILTRSGFSGYQRYAGMWTGDNTSSWEHLWFSIPLCLSLGLSGIPICGADIGGFHGDITPELLVRWYQLGALYPFSRNHSQIGTARQEPWLFGEEIENIVRTHVSFRYQIMRYLYSLTRIASTTGVPIMRPLVMEFQHDPETYTLDDQFMIGPYLMAAPILEEGAVSREVYLPKGIWYDHWTGRVLEGGQRIQVDARLEQMPIFFRAGSIVATGCSVQSTNEDQGDLILWVFPGASSETILYEDDGISDSGQSAETKLTLRETEDSLTLQIHKRVGDWKPSSRRIKIEFRGLDT
ncbi:MAG: DUF5110 domain-containing protein, partial [Candidatus Thorarchaeota archaeon]